MNLRPRKISFFFDCWRKEKKSPEGTMKMHDRYNFTSEEKTTAFFSSSDRHRQTRGSFCVTRLKSCVSSIGVTLYLFGGVSLSSLSPVASAAASGAGKGKQILWMFPAEREGEDIQQRWSAAAGWIWEEKNLFFSATWVKFCRRQWHGRRSNT